MKNKTILLLLAVLLAAWGAQPAFAQGAYGKVEGVCKDGDGNPITDAIVRFVSNETGRKYELKTDKSGHYMSIGIAPAETYTVTLIKDGKELSKNEKFPVGTGDNNLDINLQKQQAEAAKEHGMTTEQLKKVQEENKKVEQKNVGIRAINEKLIAANTALKAEDYEGAINLLTEANQIDDSHSLIWFRLADAYRGSAAKQTDKAEKDKRVTEAVTDYEKAIDMKKKEMESEKEKKPEDAKMLAGYYNNLADAYSKKGNPDGAMKAYSEAAELDPAGAGMYYFNSGAIMTNAGKMDEAIASFDKAIAADPNKAAAYYWKGVNLMGKATLKGDKMVAPEGTAEAFNKYLELEPTGPYADASKQMLDSMGAKVETSFGKKKTASKK